MPMPRPGNPLNSLVSLFAVAFLLTAWNQSQTIALYRGLPARDIANGNRANATPPSLPGDYSLPPGRRNGTAALLLRRSDSLYRKYNVSTTPIVVEKYKLLLFTIEKAGSTVLRQLMRRMMGHEDYFVHGGGVPHVASLSGLRVLTQYSLEEADGMLTGDGWTRAMFVRDPKERCLSGYLMWRPRKNFSDEVLESARKGLLNETLFGNPGVRSLARCCKDRARGDPNYEVLCYDHVRTFDGFLDMIQDPDDGDYGDGGKAGLGVPDGPNGMAWSPRDLRRSPCCPDKHWSPVTRWRMERRFYPYLNFIGHLETARWDAKRLLDRLHPRAWERYGASGWGAGRNESMFESASTVTHARGTENHLREHFSLPGTEGRVERMYDEDYDNEFLDLARVGIGEARSFYRKSFLERYGADAG